MTNLTKRQIAFLKFYEQHHTAPLALSTVLQSYRVSWLLLLLIPILGGVWCMSSGWPAMGGIYVGMGIGAFLRDVGRIRTLYRTWPMVREITDWPR